MSDGSMRKTVIIVLSLLVSAGTATGGLQLVSVNDEIRLGRQAQQQVRQEVPA
jgi:hypothetical protein